MIKKLLRTFSFIPPHKLEFENSQYLLLKDEKFVGFTQRYIIGGFYMPLGTIYATGFEGFGQSIGIPAFPFIIIGAFSYFKALTSIQLLYLNEDGKQITLIPGFSKPVKLNISEIVTAPPANSLSIGELVHQNINYSIAKSSEIIDKTILNEVLEGEEIIIEK